MVNLRYTHCRHPLGHSLFGQHLVQEEEGEPGAVAGGARGWKGLQKDPTLPKVERKHDGHMFGLKIFLN